MQNPAVLSPSHPWMSRLPISGVPSVVSCLPGARSGRTAYLGACMGEVQSTGERHGLELTTWRCLTIHAWMVTTFRTHAAVRAWAVAGCRVNCTKSQLLGENSPRRKPSSMVRRKSYCTYCSSTVVASCGYCTLLALLTSPMYSVSTVTTVGTVGKVNRANPGVLVDGRGALTRRAAARRPPRLSARIHDESALKKIR